MSVADDVRRIREGLLAAAEAVAPFVPGDVEYRKKDERDDPVTAADEAADEVLREILPSADEGWLSEESVDDRSRLACERVWVVDPIDGTREFIEGVPEWCISIGLLEGGEPVAGGIFNPATDELIVGAVGHGVTYNDAPTQVTEPDVDGGATVSVLASRSEIRRGEWTRFEGGPIEVRPCGSVAYKLGLVAAGKADATWTLVGKSEWDIAGGAALVRAAGGIVSLRDGAPPLFNQPKPVYPNFVASGRNVADIAIGRWLL